MNIQTTRSLNLIAGLILIAGSLLWLVHYSQLFYLYKFTDVQFVMVVPTWLLLLNSVFAGVGILIGVKVANRKLKALRGLFISTIVFVVCQGLEMLALS